MEKTADDKPPSENNLNAKGLASEVIADISGCENLWHEFSPSKTIFDTWEFRYSFWKGYQHKPHFIVLKDNGVNVGLLPLWYEEDASGYFWFGNSWQEENNIFVKNSKYITPLLELCPKPVHLNAISEESQKLFSNKEILIEDDPKFVLNIKDMKSSEEFLAKLDGKKRYNIKRDYRKILEQNPQLVYNNFNDFEQLIALSNARFHAKGDTSGWEDDRKVKTFEEIIKQGQLQKSYEIRMITVLIEEKYAAVDLITLYKGVYAPIKCGYNIAEFPGIGNYMNLLEIDDAISLGFQKMDFLEINYGWKDKWFETVPLYLYESNKSKD